MASIISGYEYDIFISYRHNDNRSGWVTDLVKNLREELAATIKEPASVYFDINPHDGLLETHNVDKSLEAKLKCIILIPIVSQTYCDTGSFAWQHELCAFNKMAKEDGLGRDITLANKNVASRILPIKIHDLDYEDKLLLEQELGGAMRSIEFIYKSPGVNRPLDPQDNPDKNFNKTFYRDQINKVANAIKEILYGIKYAGRVSTPIVAEESRSPIKIAPVSPVVGNSSIAVLPFASLTPDVTQAYFADGIMQNILIQLASLRHLRVISRMSVMRYEKTTKSAPEIAGELGVKYLLEGSAQSHGNKVRIHVQLIDAENDAQLWGKVFVENLEDIFAIQSSVAETVARELKATVLPDEKEKQKEVPTKNLAAYDLFMKGRHAFYQWNLAGYRTAEKYFQQALALDPDFTMAYSYLASTYSALMSWNGDLSPAESLAKINVYLTEALRRGATDNDYLTKAYVEFFISKDFPAAEQWLIKAMGIGPNNANVLYTYSYVLSMMGRYEEALVYADKGKALDPTSVSAFNYHGIIFYLMQRYEDATATFQEALQLYPYSLRQYDHLARVFLTIGDFKQAAATIRAGLASSSQRPPSMIAYLAMACVGLEQKDTALELLKELLFRSGNNEKGINLYIAHIYNSMGDTSDALLWLEKAMNTNDIDLIWRTVDPLLRTLISLSNRNILAEAGLAAPNYAGAEAFITKKLNEELPATLFYHTAEHTQDVLAAVVRIGATEILTDEEIHLLRMAALYHDSGFIESPRNHEEKGSELARQTLPAFGLSLAKIQIICNMILATKLPQAPKTLLERILCDADLDYLGRDDFYLIGDKLREEMKEGGLIETEREWNLIQKTFLESHRFHTKYGQEHREGLKRQRLQEIIAKLKKPSI